jgi:hypothetical protein
MWVIFHTVRYCGYISLTHRITVINSSSPTHAFIILYIKGHNIINSGGGKAKAIVP